LPSATRDAATDAGNLASGRTGGGPAVTEQPAPAAGATGPSPLVVGSLVLLVAGLGLGLLRWAGRRVA
jgi:hypothetical protein